MNRRKLIGHVSLLIGGALSPTLASALMQHEQAPSVPAVGYKFQFLNDKDAEFLAGICESIIPETQTPGANEAGVVDFIDMMLSDWYPENESNFIVQDLHSLQDRCVDEEGSQLSDLSPSVRLKFVSRLDKEAIHARRLGDQPLPVFATIKELTLVGYYTSEIGLRDELKIYGPMAEVDFGASGPPAGSTRY